MEDGINAPLINKDK